jgi:alpha-L-fucosidase
MNDAMTPKKQPGTGTNFSLPPKDMQWWREARFGLFIHWGVYAIPAKGEWVMWSDQIPFREYRKLADQFNPQKFDADAWAACARDAGMKYMVLTTRHHDGFCLFDSQVSDFTSVKTAAKRDFIAEYVTACRKAGLKVGFYYSPLDWRFPGYFFPNLYRESAEAMKQQTYDQVRELLTNYGKIDILWFDGGGDDWLGFGGIEWGGSQPGWHGRDSKWPQTEHFKGAPLWEPEKLYGMIRTLQPKIVMNDRAGSLGVDWGGDFGTPEGRIGEFNTTRPWETCDTLAGAWGYCRGSTMRSLRNCIHMLVNCATRDGNLLLNTGPTADGEIEPRQVRRLRDVGQWLERYGESVYGTRGGPVAPQPWGGTTHRGNRIYVHVLDWTEDEILLPPIKRKIRASHALTCRSADVNVGKDGVRIRVPPKDRQAPDTIVVLEVEGKEVGDGRTSV